MINLRSCRFYLNPVWLQIIVPNFPSGQPDWNRHKFYRHVCMLKIQALPYVRSEKLQFVKIKEFELFMEGREQ